MRTAHSDDQTVSYTRDPTPRRTPMSDSSTGVITSGAPSTRTGAPAPSGAAVINLPFWSTLTPEHGAPRATTSHHQEAPIFRLTSTNADRSRPLVTLEQRVRGSSHWRRTICAGQSVGSQLATLLE
jgi:hypothetical protein